MDKAEVLARRIVSQIIGDICDRSGLQNAWDECDDETQGEISEVWVNIAVKHLSTGNGGLDGPA